MTGLFKNNPICFGRDFWGHPIFLFYFIRAELKNVKKFLY